ncbi:MAG: M3 family oligoendopeptidase [Anaerolineae bacterium]
MSQTLPDTIDEFMSWDWDQIEPLAQELVDQEITDVATWLAEWTRLAWYVYERAARLHVASTLDTADEEAEETLRRYVETVYQPLSRYNDKLNRKLLAVDDLPEGYEVALRTIQAEIDLFCEENIPLLVDEYQCGLNYNRIIGLQTVTWNGEEVTITQLSGIAAQLERPKREEAWRLGSQRVLEDREAINANWIEVLKLRQQIAQNAGYDSYRDYAWLMRGRFDYTPADSETFHAAIEKIVVPAAARVYERFREQLGVDTLRPWDLNVNPMRATDIDLDPLGRPALTPFADVDTLVAKVQIVFDSVDPELGAYFKLMEQNQMLDLANTRGKAPGAYCTTYPITGSPFIFMNAVGKHNDLQTMLHESGHAFHAFETLNLPYLHQRDYPLEFAEVASMAMELLAAPYLETFYTPEDAARARIEHLQGILLFWPYMAVVDAFQHWAYTHVEEALDPNNCDAKWAELWQRFIVGVDYTGLEEDMKTGWHRKQHIHRSPFYYIEYGLAQLGAVQVWANSLENQTAALTAYRQALSLGGTAKLPDLYSAAGARLAFDADTLNQAVDLVETTIHGLGQV